KGSLVWIPPSADPPRAESDSGVATILPHRVGARGAARGRSSTSARRPRPPSGMLQKLVAPVERTELDRSGLFPHTPGVEPWLTLPAHSKCLRWPRGLD